MDVCGITHYPQIECLSPPTPTSLALQRAGVFDWQKYVSPIVAVFVLLCGKANLRGRKFVSRSFLLPSCITSFYSSPPPIESLSLILSFGLHPPYVYVFFLLKELYKMNINWTVNILLITIVWNSTYNSIRIQIA